MNENKTYIVGLGANLGDRVSSLKSAVFALKRCGTVLAVSALYESAAVGPPQPDYLNAAGLTDYRTDVFLPWFNVCGARLYITTTNGKTSTVTMYVKAVLGAEVKEIPFNVLGLDRPYNKIAELVIERAMIRLGC